MSMQIILQRQVKFHEDADHDYVRHIHHTEPLVKSPCLPNHLVSLFKSATESTQNTSEKDAIKDTLIEFAGAVSSDEHDLGLTHLTEHAIDTGNSRPLKQPPRRTPIAFQGEEQKATLKLQKQGAIRPSTSPWASPLVLVRKKNGVDYRRVNSVTTKDAFPIPRVQDCLDAVSGAVIFFILDNTSAYHQIPVKMEDIGKTAFCSKYGLWEFVTMPFGLICNAIATFQCTLELSLSGLQWTTCPVYLDDVILFGHDFDSHMTKLKAVLDRILKAYLKLGPDKCHLFKEYVSFLGHII